MLAVAVILTLGLTYFADVSGVSVEITGPHHVFAGEPLTLDCVIPTEELEKALSVKWFFTPPDSTNKLSLYTYWLLENAIPRRRNEGNEFLDLTVEPPTSVRILHTDISNTGTYQCYAEESLQSKHNVTIIKLPQVNLTTSVDDGEELSDGDEIEVNCTVTESHPSPVVHWILDGKRIELETDKQHNDGGHLYRTTLKVESNHLGKEFGCRAEVRSPKKNFQVKSIYFLNSTPRNTVLSTSLLIITSIVLILQYN